MSFSFEKQKKYKEKTIWLRKEKEGKKKKTNIIVCVDAII